MIDALAHLPTKTGALIRGGVAAATGALGAAVEGVSLIGGAARPDRPDRARHPELLILVGGAGISVAGMHALGEAMRPFVRKGLRFRTLTLTELESGADVYALEIAQWQAHHRHLHGEDRLSDVRVAPAHLRHELERSLRGIARRARNRLMQGVAGGASDLDGILADAFTHLLIAGHHTLTLAGQTPPARESELLGALATWLELDGARATAVLRRLRAKERGGDPFIELECLLELLDGACRRVDAIDVGEVGDA